MTHQQTVSAEQYSHKVTAEYNSHSEADRAIAALEERTELPSSQIELVEPHDPDMARKVEPESKGIAGLLVKSHVGLGLGGLVFGLALAAVLATTGPAITQSSPVMTFIALGFIFPTLALLLAGVISLRPDHDPMIAKTRSATDKGRWTVVAHCSSMEQQKRVKDIIGYSVQTL